MSLYFLSYLVVTKKKNVEQFNYRFLKSIVKKIQLSTSSVKITTPRFEDMSNRLEDFLKIPLEILIII